MIETQKYLIPYCIKRTLFNVFFFYTLKENVGWTFSGRFLYMTVYSRRVSCNYPCTSWHLRASIEHLNTSPGISPNAKSEQTNRTQMLTCRGCSVARCGSVLTLLLGWLTTLVTGCLKMEAVCLMGSAVFRSGFP